MAETASYVVSAGAGECTLQSPPYSCFQGALLPHLPDLFSTDDMSASSLLEPVMRASLVRGPFPLSPRVCGVMAPPSSTLPGVLYFL